MIKRLTKVICLTLLLTCLLATSVMASAHTTAPNTNDIVIQQNVEQTISGTLKVEPIYYIMVVGYPRPGDPLYDYSLTTPEGDTYRLDYKGNELGKHDGAKMTVTGVAYTAKEDTKWIKVSSYCLD